MSDSQSACLFWVDYSPRSLAPLGWFLQFAGDATLLESCAERLAATAPWPLVVVTPVGMKPVVEPLIRQTRALIYEVPTTKQAPGLAQATLALLLDRVVLVHGLMGLDLLPETLVADQICRREHSGADVMAASGLPSPLMCTVCSRRAMEVIAALPDNVMIPESPQVLFERIVDAAATDLRIETCTVLQNYGLTEAELPKHIPWVAPQDVERLKKLSEVTAPHSRERLVTLRKWIIEVLEKAHRGTEARRVQPSGRLRILYASAPSAYSGGEECLVNSVCSVSGDCIEAYALVANEGRLTGRLRGVGATVICPQRNIYTPSVENVLLADQVLQQVRPDIVHCNAAVGTPFLAAAALRRIPLVQWVRLAQLDGFDEHLLCADRITAVSSFVADEIAKRMVDSGKTRILYDPVDCRRFSPESPPVRNVRCEFQIEEKDFLVLCVARFAANKRHDILLRAIAALARSYTDLKLMLIGDIQPGPHLQARTTHDLQELGIRDRTILLEFQPDIQPFEAAADAIVLCSEREPLGTVVLEGMAMGKPIVVSNSGGLPEMIEHGVTGLHCEPGDAASLAAQIRALIENPRLAKNIGDAARKTAVQRFSFQAHAAALQAIYDELIAA